MWIAAASAYALSLGGSQGNVLLGGQVDLTFEVQPDPGADVATSCISAKVVSGDTQIGDAKVRVVPDPEMRGQPSAVRVLANVTVDEPVLRVALSGGCAGKVTRTYTFLPEPPTSNARSGTFVNTAPVALRSGVSSESGQGASLASLSQQAAPPPATSTLPLGKQVSASETTRRSSVTPPVKRAVPVRLLRNSERVTLAKASPADVVAAPRSRLVIEPLDTWLDGPVSLRSSLQLMITPPELPTLERDQAALLWKSLNIHPQDLQQDAERLRVVQADLVALRASAGSEQAAAAKLRQQLEVAEQERFSASIVYFLGSLLLAALLLLVWMGLRIRSSSDKAVQAWRDSVALETTHMDPSGGPEHIPQRVAPTGNAWMPPETLRPLIEPEHTAAPDVVTMVPIKNTLAVVPAPLVVKASDPSSSRVLHIVNPEELFDIQQQAEFFISVGEHQQAIDVLKNHIAAHRETSPLAYLELLRLFHTLSRVDDFSQLRMQFMQFFNARVPDFVGFHRTGRMLYHYEDALVQIEAQWTSPSVLGLLERFLFRREGIQLIEPFDLAAYDDLLLLLAIAQTTPATDRGAPPPRKRTTPLAEVGTKLSWNEVPEPIVNQDDLLLDSLAASLEFDFDLEPLQRSADASFIGVTPLIPAPITAPGSYDMPLDLDLSEPPHLTLSDLPPVAVTLSPAQGQAVGFGMDNDLVELSLELGQKKPTDPR